VLNVLFVLKFILLYCTEFRLREDAQGSFLFPSSHKSTIRSSASASVAQQAMGSLLDALKLEIQTHTARCYSCATAEASRDPINFTVDGQSKVM